MVVLIHLQYHLSSILWREMGIAHNDDRLGGHLEARFASELAAIGLREPYIQL